MSTQITIDETLAELLKAVPYINERFHMYEAYYVLDRDDHSDQAMADLSTLIDIAMRVTASIGKPAAAPTPPATGDDTGDIATLGISDWQQQATARLNAALAKQKVERETPATEPTGDAIGPQRPPDNPMIFNRQQPDGTYRPVSQFWDKAAAKVLPAPVPAPAPEQRIATSGSDGWYEATKQKEREGKRFEHFTAHYTDATEPTGDADDNWRHIRCENCSGSGCLQCNYKGYKAQFVPKVQPAPVPAPAAAAKRVKLSKADVKELALVSDHDLDFARVANNAPAQHRRLLRFEKRGWVKRFDVNYGGYPIKVTIYWRITDLGRLALAQHGEQS